MAVRFRRSIRLGTGARINVGKRGLSLSSGMKGATVTAGKGGLYGNLGIPGTGLSNRQKLSASKGTERHGAARTRTAEVTLSLDEDGSVKIHDQSGSPLRPADVQQLRRQHGEFIRDWLVEQSDKWNQGIDAILNIHLDTPMPAQEYIFQLAPYELPEPLPTKVKSAGIQGWLFKSHKEKMIRENNLANTEYLSNLCQWKLGRDAHIQAQDSKRYLMEVGRLQDSDAMQEFLEGELRRIDWPRETDVSFEVDSDGTVVMIDVDLPEIEDLPGQQAAVAARGFKINIKSKSDAKRRREYMTHIHAIAFRVVGVTFAALPTVQKVAISGYSQRPDGATGNVLDQYLFSIRLNRSRWMNLNFDNLDEIDLPVCLGAFDIRRKMTKTGIISSIIPFDSTD